MPQFDVVVFINEIIWVFFFFILLYSFNYLFFFPRIAEILKTRIKKVELDLITLNSLNKKLNSFFLEKENYFFNSILLNIFNDYINLNFNVGLMEKLFLLKYNFCIDYYLNNLYNSFDFFELEQY